MEDCSITGFHKVYSLVGCLEGIKGEIMPEERRRCSWEVIRFLSTKPMPKCEPPEWKVKVAENSVFWAGETFYLCDHHKKNLALRYEKVEKL